MIWRVALLLLALAALGVGVAGWREAQRDPVVRRASIGLPGWPDGAPPVTLLLVSDTHVSRPDMPPERLEAIVARLNRLSADIVILAGDYSSDKWFSQRVSLDAAIAPLGRFRAPLGIYAVLGNHEHYRGVADARRALVKAGIKMLKDDAAVAGPLVIGGIDDSVTNHSDFELTIRKMAKLRGAKLLVSHAKNHFRYLPADVKLMLSGHTHCGQVPLLKPGEACGVVRRGNHLMIVGAGLGTSAIPVRLGAPPDVWLLTLGPERAR